MDARNRGVNSRRGAVEFEADGTAYVMAFTTNAMVRYADAAGESLVEGFQKVETGGLDVRRVREMFRVAVTPAVTAEEAGDLIDALGLKSAIDLLGRAARAAFDGLEAADGDKVEPGNGQSPAKTS